MKTSFFKSALFAACLFCGTLAPGLAQAKEKPRGYWVVETNLKLRNYTLVRFYDERHHLVYEEHLPGYNLDMTRPKNKKMLDRTLRQLLENKLVASSVTRFR